MAKRKLTISLPDLILEDLDPQDTQIIYAIGETIHKTAPPFSEPAILTIRDLNLQQYISIQILLDDIEQGRVELPLSEYFSHSLTGEIDNWYKIVSVDSDDDSVIGTVNVFCKLEQPEAAQLQIPESHSCDRCSYLEKIIKSQSTELESGLFAKKGKNIQKMLKKFGTDMQIGEIDINEIFQSQGSLSEQEASYLKNVLLGLYSKCKTLASSEMENANLRQELIESYESHRELQESVRETIQELETQNQQHSEMHQNALVEKEECITQLNEVITQLNQANLQIEEYQAQVQRLQAEISGFQNQQQETVNWQKYALELEEVLKSSEKQRQEFIDSYNEITAQMESYRQAKDKQMGEEYRTIQGLEKQILEIKEENLSYEKAQFDLSQQLGEFKKLNCEQKAEIIELTRQLKHANYDVQLVGQENSELQQHLNNLESNYCKDKEEANKFIDEFSTLLEKYDRCQANNEELQGKVMKQTVSIQELEQEVTALKAQLIQGQTEMEVIVEQQQESQTVIDNLSSITEAYKKELDELKDRQEELRRQNSELKAKQLEAQNQLEEVQEKCELFRKECQLKAIEISNLTYQCKSGKSENVTRRTSEDSLKTENERLRFELEKSHSQLQELRNQLKTYTEQVHTIKCEHDYLFTLIKEFKSYIQSSLNPFTKSHTANKSENNISFYDEYMQLQQQFKEYQQNYVDLQLTVRELSENKENLSQQLLQNERHINSLQSDLSLNSQHTSSLQDQLQKAKIEDSKAKLQTSQYSSLENRLSASQKLASDLQQQLDRNSSDFQQKIKTFSTLNEDTLTKLQQCQEQNNELANQLEEKANECSHLQQQVIENKGELTRIEQHLCIQEDMSSMLDALQQEVSQLQQDKKLAAEEMDFLVNYIATQAERGQKAHNLIISLRDALQKRDKEVTQMQGLVKQLNKRKPQYVAVKEDPIDSALAEYINTRLEPLQIQFTREDNGVYLFGTKRVFIKLENGKVIIRVGGGYMLIEEFIEIYTPIELEKLENRQYEDKNAMRKAVISKITDTLTDKSKTFRNDISPLKAKNIIKDHFGSTNSSYTTCYGVTKRSASPQKSTTKFHF